MYNILLLEDDFKMAAEIKLFFNKHDYRCDVVYDGVLFFKQLEIDAYNLFILDVNVPLINGMEVCKKIRTDDKSIPILMLTAYSALQDKVDALGAGADDYLVKPFHLEELLARVRALIRRSSNRQTEDKSLFQVDDLIINTSESKVVRAGIEISLTPKEYKLLELLAFAQGRIVSKQTIAAKVWDINFETGTNTIEVYINYLRNKVDKGFGRALIQTRAGFGYYLK